MTRCCLAMVGLFCFFTSMALGQSGATNPVQTFTAPQVVIGPTVTSEIVLLNSANTTCDLTVTLHQGNGNLAPDPFLVNGQNLGNPFPVEVPAWGSRDLSFTTEGSEQFQGGAAIELQKAGCIDAIKAQIQYQIFTGAGELSELFSYPIPSPTPLNSCAKAPVNFDPDPSDGQTNIPGFANVSLKPLSGVLRTMTLFDSDGNPIETRPPDTYNGQHQTGLLTDFFPDLAQGFSGSWRVCYEGQPSSSPTEPTKIDTLFIDVVQTPTIFQFDSNEHSQENPECEPDDRTMCLNDNRFRVTVEWSQPPQFDQPGFVRDKQPDDTGEFFFFNPDNTEMIVKVLDGCNFNDHFWVFYGATTNVEFTLTVTDTLSGIRQEFFNPLGQPAPAITDTQAFATCP